jgi:hypothetical protein
VTSLDVRLAVVAALALVSAAGCGGSTTLAGGGTGLGGAGAELVPASAPLYFAIDTDLSSDQWQTVDTLLERFPAKSELLAKLRRSFERKAKVRWEDVEPALGDELDIAVLDFERDTNVVALTRPRDEAKFDDLIAKLNAASPGRHLVTATKSGWTLVADSRAKLERFTGASGRVLADDATFKAAMGRLAEDALLKAYANGRDVGDELKRLFPSVPVGQIPGQGHWTSLAGDVTAADEGVKLDLVVEWTPGYRLDVRPYTAKLPDEVPADVLAFLSFNGPAFEQQLFNASFRAQRSSLGPEAKALLGLVRRLTPIFENENALYVRRGALIPEVTLLAQPEKPRAAVRNLKWFVEMLGALTFTPLLPRPAEVAGTKGWEVSLGRLSISFGALGRKLFVTDFPTGLADLTEAGPKLAGDATFEHAKDVSGLPRTNAGFLYVNLKDAIPVIEGYIRLAGATIPPDVSANLRPLRTLMGYQTTQGRTATFTLFLEIA